MPNKKGHDRVFFIYVKVNGNGMLRLWCEVDNKKENEKGKE